jgi:hypothetical protein
MKKLIIAVLAVLMMTVGCASLQVLSDQVVQAKMAGKGGVTKVYPVSANQAWEIAEAVFRWEKADEVTENRKENYLVASSGMKMAAFGTVMGVWIEPVDQITTRLTVIVKQRGDCCELTSLTPKRFFQRFEQGVAYVKGGRKLPISNPATPLSEAISSLPSADQ